MVFGKDGKTAGYRDCRCAAVLIAFTMLPVPHPAHSSHSRPAVAPMLTTQPETGYSLLYKAKINWRKWFAPKRVCP